MYTGRHCFSILTLAARFYKGTGYIEYPAKMNAISIHYRTYYKL